LIVPRRNKIDIPFPIAGNNRPGERVAD